MERIGSDEVRTYGSVVDEKVALAIIAERKQAIEHQTEILRATAIDPMSKLGRSAPPR
jgi:hypothetical protein